MATDNREGMHIILGSTHLNYADLPPNTLPASAWFNAPGCYSIMDWFMRPSMPSNASFDMVHYATGAAYISSFGQEYPECGTIWEGEFLPQLVVPTQINDLQPAWKSCVGLFGFYDPPKALGQVSVEAAPTTPGGVSSESASPSQTATVAPQTQSIAQTQTVTEPPVALSSTSTVQTASESPVNPASASNPPNSLDSSPSTSATSSSNEQSSSSASPVPVTLSSTQQSAQTQDPTENPSDDSQQQSATGSLSTTSPGPSIQQPESDSVPSAGSSTQDPGDIIGSVLGGATSSSSNGETAQPVNAQSSLQETGVSNSPQQTNTPIDASDEHSSPTSTAPQQTVASIGSQQVTGSRASGVSGAVVVAGGDSSVTLPSGASAATIAGQQVSINSDGAVVASSGTLFTTIALPPPESGSIAGSADADSTVVSIGGSVLPAKSSGNAIVLGTAIVSVGGAAQTVNGQVVSAASDGLHVGTAIVSVPSAEQALNEPVNVQAATQAVFTGSDGRQMTVQQQGSSAVVADGSSTVTLALGSQATFDGKVVSAPSTGGAVILDGSSLAFSTVTPESPDSVTGAVVTGSNGQAITAVQQKSAVILKDGSSTITVPFGADVTFDGHAVSIPTAPPDAIMLDGSSVALTAADAEQTAAEEAIATGSDGQPFTIAQSGSLVILADASLTTTLPIGYQATLDGNSISLSSIGGIADVDGTLVSLSSYETVASTAAEAVITGSSGQRVTVSQSGSLVILADASLTTTLPLGSQATFDGETISVPNSGDVANVDGSAVTLSGSADPMTSTAAEAVITGSSNQQVTVLQQGSSLILQAASTTVTLIAGEQTTIDGQTISAPSSSGVVVVDGSAVPLSHTPPTTSKHATSGPEVSTAAASTQTSSTSASSSAGRNTVALVHVLALAWATFALVS
ncbi:hypothetical protein LTR08_005459 [Meristemomyces frigidus]|nr:hypothetical protein LTR08_005459 [Meristemomyces frigidus]